MGTTAACVTRLRSVSVFFLHFLHHREWTGIIFIMKDLAEFLFAAQAALTS